MSFQALPPELRQKILIDLFKLVDGGVEKLRLTQDAVVNLALVSKTLEADVAAAITIRQRELEPQHKTFGQRFRRAAVVFFSLFHVLKSVYIFRLEILDVIHEMHVIVQELEPIYRELNGLAGGENVLRRVHGETEVGRYGYVNSRTSKKGDKRHGWDEEAESMAEDSSHSMHECKKEQEREVGRSKAVTD